MSGTFTPKPGSAPLARQIAAQASMEARLMLRNGEQLLLAVVIPVIVLVGGVARRATGSASTFPHPAVDVFTPGVLALAVMSTAFTSLAIATGFERRYGVIKRLGSSPLPRSGLLGGQDRAPSCVIEVLQIAVISGVALLLGWSPAGGPCSAAVARGRPRARPPSPRSACSSPACCAPRPPWPRPTSSTCC